MAAIKIIPSRMKLVDDQGFATPEFFRVMQALQQRTGGVSGVFEAVDITSTATGDVAATNVQAAIAELASEKATVVALAAHIADAIDAHDASAISNVPAGGISSSTVQGALNELDNEKQPIDADLTSWAGVARAAGFDSFAATPSSANLATLVSDETGSGALVFATSPTLVTPALGTPASGNLANCTFPTLNQNTTGTASNVTGTVAVANGGTGDTGTAWTTYTPTVTDSVGTFTTLGTLVGRYKDLGKTRFISVVVNITTNGTAGGTISISLPSGTVAAECMVNGRETGLTGKAITGTIQSGTSDILVLDYLNNYAGGSGARLVLSGVIEMA
jgi:hypothetical protein